MEHASEIVPYLLTIIGFLAVYVLNGIKGDIKEVKNTFKTLEKDLRDGFGNLDRRVTALETRCSLYHDGEK